MSEKRLRTMSINGRRVCGVLKHAAEGRDADTAEVLLLIRDCIKESAKDGGSNLHTVLARRL